MPSPKPAPRSWVLTDDQLRQLLVEGGRKRGTRKHTASRERTGQKPALTVDQRAMLPYLAAGATNREIAAVEHYCCGTIKRRVNAVLDQLGARNRAHAVVIATRLGLYDPHDVDSAEAIIDTIIELYNRGQL